MAEKMAGLLRGNAVQPQKNFFQTSFEHGRQNQPGKRAIC
jgi:hypothetical protein